jgi:phage RecT family recombinase
VTDTDLPAVKNIGEALCIRYEGDIKRALNHELVRGMLNFEPFVAAVKQDVLNNPKLAEAFRADPGSAINAMLMAAQMKLVPGSAYEYIYMIPRRNKQKGHLEVQPMLSYKGMCELAQRHPRVHKVEAFCVYEGEHFRFFPGEGRIEHEWSLEVDRSDDKLIAAYARIVITDPSGQHPIMQDPVVWVMSRKEIEKCRSRSDAWKNAEAKGWTSSPWHTDFPMMARKTVLRAALTKGSVPKDMGVGGAIAQDDRADLAEEAPLSLPPRTVQASIREGLGIDKSPDAFASAADATAAFEAATTLDEVNAVAERCQHFTGEDAVTAAAAYDKAALRVEGDDD